MHHVHVSTGFAFVIALFVFALVAVVLAFIVSLRRDKRAAAAYDDMLRKHGESYADREVRYFPGYPSAPMPPPSFVSPAYTVPVHAAPVYVNSGSSADLFTGVLLGEAIAGGHHHDTVVVERGGDYVQPDPGFTYDQSPAPDVGGGLDFDFGD